MTDYVPIANSDPDINEESNIKDAHEENEPSCVKCTTIAFFGSIAIYLLYLWFMWVYSSRLDVYRPVSNVEVIGFKTQFENLSINNNNYIYSCVPFLKVTYNFKDGKYVSYIYNSKGFIFNTYNNLTEFECIKKFIENEIHYIGEKISGDCYVTRNNIQPSDCIKYCKNKYCSCDKGYRNMVEYVFFVILNIFGFYILGGTIGAIGVKCDKKNEL
jgi:hypothetical protein